MWNGDDADPGERNIPRLTPRAEASIDLAALTSLRTAVGETMFEEVFEDAIYEVTERLARIEHAAIVGDLFSVSRLAHDLATIAGRIGLSGVSEIASQLESCCAAEEMVAARAVTDRLIRVGEESLVRAAELSVEISATQEGA